MPVSKNLCRAMHQQDTDYSCGAACARWCWRRSAPACLIRMIFTRTTTATAPLTLGLTGTPPPTGLQWTMMDSRHRGHQYFALYALDTEDLISRKTVLDHHTIMLRNRLVYGWGHGSPCAVYGERSICNSADTQLYDRPL